MTKQDQQNSKHRSEQPNQTQPQAGHGLRLKAHLSSGFEAFAALARHNATGFNLRLPSELSGQARREHVRFCLLEDHAERIDKQAQGTGEKFQELSDSLFSFFRGTALLFYRDMAGLDAHQPVVMLLGDVHPENFGIMPNIDGAPIFSVNDFDEAAYGPFTWDIRRGATGFVVAAKEVGGFKSHKRKKIAKHFIKGYIDGVEGYAKHGNETHDVYRMDNAPKLIKSLFEQALTDRKSWLEDRYINSTGLGFRVSDELTPISSRVAEFQKLIDQLAEQNNIQPSELRGTLRVKDVALRHGQGTASLGLERYYLLLEGPSKNATDDLIIEFKRARKSAMQGLMGFDENAVSEHAKRVATGQRVHIPNGDIFYGHVTLDGESMLTRERAPFRDDVDLDDLSYKEWKQYARICGKSLALAHARSDEAGKLTHDVEPLILEAVQPTTLFIDDMLSFACETATRLKTDHKRFKKDFKLGAFELQQR